MRPLLLQAAMHEELDPVVAALSGTVVSDIGPWRFWQGNIGGQDVVVSRSDEGPLNAAAASALGLHIFQPGALISFGIAGAHDPELRRGDLLVGREAVDYSGFRSTAACVGDGIDCGRWSPKPHKIRTSADIVTPFFRFVSDSRLVELASTMPYEAGRVVLGAVGTALQFNLEPDRVRWLRETYGTDSADQESAYAAGVATAMGVPFLALRVISDSVFHDPVVDKTYGRLAANAALSLVDSITAAAARMDALI